MNFFYSKVNFYHKGIAMQDTHGRYSFTLIEVLIVIAIISILASMMLPALNKARQRALSTQCISQLKQCGYSFFLYAGDNMGYAPASSFTFISNSDQFYPRYLALLKYLPRWVNDKTRHLTNCPAAPAPNGGSGARCYGIPYFDEETGVLLPNTNKVHIPVLRKLKKNDILLADSVRAGLVNGSAIESNYLDMYKSGNMDLSLARDTNNFTKVFSTRHTNGRSTNLLFPDGSAKSVNIPSIQKMNRYFFTRTL